MNTRHSKGIEQFAAMLREAHERLRNLRTTEQEKLRLLRHLTAITDAAKRDTARAASRLERFLRELNDRAHDDE
jgi:hypothetical protein